MIDPICNMEVEENTAAGRFEYGGKMYLFCSLHCLEKFKEDPAGYVAPGKQSAAEETQVPAGATYVCPMDPEVRQQGPGACPKCGMALEPLDIGAALTK
ncbi:MAG TPA: YHS domain-containing protein, partial [Methylomirabilota bacterium]|nr:YHS domain-containing protein [Methylomirabilota bacterium]